MSLLALLLTAVVIGAEQASIEPKDYCRSWTFYNSTRKTCVCGDPLQGIVNCFISNNSGTVLLKLCYCMSYYNSEVVVGECLVSCIHPSSFGHYRSVNITETGGDPICSGFHRRGPMCGECEQNHAPPVYHYNFTCVECSEYKWNWLKYIAVAYLPLTIFYFLVLTLKISATTGSLNAFVTINQLAAAPGVVRFYALHSLYRKLIKFITALCTIWNLDFLRSVYEPFCLHPSMTTIQAFSLDYLLGIYPLLLILVTFFFVKLHDQYSVVVFLWRPFYRCLSRFSHTLNIKTSLVQVFAAFILLSYVKILNVSFDILSPGGKYLKRDGQEINKLHWYYNGSLEYFGREHAPYAALALIMSFIFNILPLILLLLYPFHCFRRFLHCLRLDSSGLSIFMDTFYGCYRTQPSDCRHFSVVYIFFRGANLLLFSLSRGLMYFSYAGYLFMLALVIVAIIRPYRNTWHNVSDIMLFLSISMFYGYINFIYEVDFINPEVSSFATPDVSRTIILTILSIPSCYGLFTFTWWILPRCWIMKLKVYFRQIIGLPCTRQRTDNSEECLPYRLQQSTEHSPLL